MSVIVPPKHRIHQFFRSSPTPCPYIPGRVERKLFTRLEAGSANQLNSSLTEAGFRRSHDIIYRPVCSGCNACVPVRLPVDRFLPSRTQRRIIRRNADLRLEIGEPRADEEQYALFRAYQNSRHGGGDMAQMGLEDYQAMIEEGGVSGAVLEVRDDGGTLLGLMMMDRLRDGVSAVYSFYDPDQQRRSLGSFMILALIDAVASGGGQHVYLGYWIRNSEKMAYKTRFRPIQALGPDGWRDLYTDP